MKLAIYNGCSCHHEMFGYIIDFCIEYNHTLDIYSETRENLGWILFYVRWIREKKYTTIKFMNLSRFHTYYDWILLTTDDDWTFTHSVTNVIAIDHYCKNRRPSIQQHIGTRWFSERPTLDWILPVYIINENYSSNLNIVVIGANVPKNEMEVSRMMNLFTNSHNFQFNLISRNIDINLFKSYSNVIIYQSIQTEQMLDIIKNSQYILVLDIDDHIAKSMSGCIPIAFSMLRQLILPFEMNNYYKFNSCITYKENCPFELHPYCNIESVKKERDVLIQHRNNVFIKNLAKYTALIVEPRKLEKVPAIIKHFQKTLGNEWRFVFYHGKDATWDLDNVELRALTTNNFTPNEYNDFLKKKELWSSLYGQYVLVFQADTWIYNDENYTINDYIDRNYSYVGGNMSYRWTEASFPAKYHNFNGGLSLRNIADMLLIIEKFPPKTTVNKYDNMPFTECAEDVYFTIGGYKLNMKMGDDEYSSHFACHTIYHNNLFGIHQPDLYCKNMLMNNRVFNGLQNIH